MLDVIIGAACTAAAVILVAGAWVDTHWRLRRAEHSAGPRRDMVRRLLDRQIERGN